MPWPLLKKQIETHLKQDRDAVVTTFIDFYGIHDRHLFPKWEDGKKIIDPNNRMGFLEEAMKDDIEGDQRYRFVPYIQLHEFEGLLFNRIEIFINNFTAQEADLVELEKIISQHSNPELINDGHDTAPSKRLQKLISGYNKVIYGAILAEEIGLAKIRAKSPRFNRWLETLEN